MKALITALALLALSGCAPLAPSYRDTSVNITSNALFDPARYAGTWYEIASFPTRFQRGCTGTKAQYTPGADGDLAVLNTCRDGSLTGPERRIEGSARVVGPGRLAVQLDGVPFVRAPYWVLWVDEDYQTAVIGIPSGRAGWILNRSPRLRADRLQAARDVLEFNGYDLSKLRMTPQP